jgi:ABC-type polysaccharide/polyol phosphate export permease
MPECKELVDYNSDPYFKAKNLLLSMFLAHREIKIEMFNFFLGFLWWFFNPIFYMCIFYFIGVVVFKTRTEDYAAFLLTGLTMYRGAQSGTLFAGIAIFKNIGLSRQVYIPKYVFIVKELIVTFLKFFVALFILFAVLWLFFDRPLESTIFQLAPIIFLQFLMCISVGSIISVLNILIPDLRNLFPLMFTGGMYVSGIFFERDRIPQDWQFLLDINPYAFLIENGRNVILYNQPADMTMLMIWSAGFGVLAIFSLLFVRKLEPYFARIIA